MKTHLSLLGWRALRLPLALAGALLAAHAAAAQAGNPVAALNEDVQMLARQVERLRLEVETLRASNAELQKQLLTSRDVQTLVQNAAAAVKAEVRAETDKANAALRKEIVDEVAKQIEALVKETNKQFAALAKAMPAGGGAPGGTGGGNPPTVVPVFNEDFPKTGVTYAVQPGDTLSRIAARNNSTVAWIQNANKIADANRDLRVGDKIFIPQRSAASAP